MRRARRRSDAEKDDARVSAEEAEKNEPGENSSLSRLDNGEVVPVDELLEAYAPRVANAVFNRSRKEDGCGRGESDWNILKSAAESLVKVEETVNVCRAKNARQTAQRRGPAICSASTSGTSC